MQLSFLSSSSIPFRLLDRTADHSHLLNMRVGFLGLGTMGTPMALNLTQRYALTIWNRSASKYSAFEESGATIGDNPLDVIHRSDVIFTMLFNEAAMRSVVDDELVEALRGKILVNASSVPVSYSKDLAERVREAGGHFVEMPVSGSKEPAEEGRLVGLLAGEEEIVRRVEELIAPMTTAMIYCGPIGSGLKMKYTLNLFVTTMATGLAEAMNLVHAQSLPPEAFAQALEAGPMASTYSKHKIDKMISQDWSPQASVRDCYNSSQLIESAARAVDCQVPMLHTAAALYERALSDGLGDEDMIAVVRDLIARSEVEK